MQELEGSVKPIEVTFKVPALQWLRLQWLSEEVRSAVMGALPLAIRASLDELGVPGTVEGLLDADGHLVVAAQEPQDERLPFDDFQGPDDYPGDEDDHDADRPEELDSSGHLQVAEGDAELAKRWEANYIYADGDPADEEET